MMARLRLQALVALSAAGLPGGLAAQVAGLPVRNAGLGTGIGVAADLGFPSAAAGKGLAFGATGTAGLGPLGITASVSHYAPKGADAFWSVGGTGNLKVFGGPLIPLAVTLQAGVARSSGSSAPRSWHVPVGLGVALTIPNPVFAIKPWVAPRLDVTRTTGPGGETAKKFGISAGVDFGFLSGLSIRAMYDRVTADGGHPSVLSLGLGYRVGR